MTDDILHKMITKLEALAEENIPISEGLDLLEDTAQSYDELIVINVIRESFGEVVVEELFTFTA